jgi:3-phenylpropionate/trans-cinnamate dioxygenase ferredoxin component
MGQWIAACAAGDIDPEDVVPFVYDGKDYAIYRSPGDGYYATDAHCTHEQTLLCDGLVIGNVIECPKHNGRFDYTSGQALGAPVLGRRANLPGQGGGRHRLHRGRLGVTHRAQYAVRGWRQIGVLC